MWFTGLIMRDWEKPQSMFTKEEMQWLIKVVWN